MSSVSIRAALEGALNGITPALATAWENMPFTPSTGTAYQRVHLLLADPLMLEQSQRWHRERGFLQVSLCYPLENGPNAAQARAELIRDTFRAGRPLTSGSVTVTVDGVPGIRPAQIEDDRYVLPVRINFFAHIMRS